MSDPNKKSPRTFQCRDVLWETFEQMARELECSIDYLINEAMKQYARQRSYGTRSPFPGRPEAGSAPAAVPPPPVSASAGVASAAPAMGSGPAAPPPPMPVSALPSSGPGLPPPPPKRGGTLPPPPPVSRNRPPTLQGQVSAPVPPPPPPSAAGAAGRFPPPPPPPKRGGTQGFPQPPMPPGMAQRSAPPPMAGPSQPAPIAPPYGQPPRASIPQPPPPAQPQPPQAGSSLFGPQLTIWYTNQPHVVTKDRFVIGRGKQSSDLTIKDPNVSRQHAMVEFLNGQYYMVDMGSTNGIEYNGQRIARKAIADGDVFRICDHDLRFTYR